MLDDMKNSVHNQLNALCGTFTYTQENKAVLSGISNQLIEGKKGVLLRGNVGSGKTTIMKAFWMSLRTTKMGFGMKSALSLAGEFAKGGYDEIDRYIKKPKSDTFTGIFCFDDLGMEGNSKFYGNDLNVMAAIISHRYELFKQGYLTHFTTNMTDEEIEYNYGDAALSRLYEMCQFYVLGSGNSKDWRKRMVYDGRV